jgi:Zn-dependent protease
VDSELSIIEKAIAFGIPILLAITLHEAAHAYAAFMLGDRTAKDQGRMSLNPFRHIDPVGTIVLPTMLFLASSPFLFGWAKPVPIEPRYFKNRRRDTMWVALAGPLMNVFLAMVSVRLLSIVDVFPQAYQNLAIETFKYGLLINIFLAVLNMLPIPPLDGGKVLAGLLPSGPASRLEQFEKYGMLPLLLLLVGLPLVGMAIGMNLNPLGWVVLGISDWVIQGIAALAGLSSSGS